jgi:hypothetical protein
MFAAPRGGPGWRNPARYGSEDEKLNHDQSGPAAAMTPNFRWITYDVSGRLPKTWRQGVNE